ncbi:NAD-dependent succinate-semialdehyde dehydrogenase [Ascidiimonas aurantiaca]|uniref:NAD-dependent succinate-semialdehyde dehydrogenase n=1 Tax=Ascidiimonas aurantiaca TaxID=1685432 RepID=UPI0030ED61E9
MITTKNPYNQKVVKEYSTLTSKELWKKTEASHTAFVKWRDFTFEERARLFISLANVLRQNKVLYARNITVEMGKPISQAIAEIEKCAWVCEYYAQNAASFLKEEPIASDALLSYVRYDPLGVLLAVMPWNYPFWQVFRFAVPALMAGNTAVLKHAGLVMGSAFKIEEAFIEAGFPPYIFQNLCIPASMVNEVIRHSRVKAVTLTGSKSAGAAVAAEAAKNIKKAVLELGGSNAFIVSKHADIEKAVETAVHARFQNTGQSCIAAKRVLLQKEIANVFITRFCEKIEALKTGDPLLESTYIGVLPTPDFAVELGKQLSQTLEMGGKLVMGGKYSGTFFEPTVVTQVSMEMPLFKEETFGPVIGIGEFNTMEEAIEISNASEFGLGVTLFTENKDEKEKWIGAFDDGAVFINEMVKSDPRLPFGGTKISGFGRELGYFGIREFVNVKTVYIK